VWSYFTYDQSLRLIIRPRKLSQMEEDSWLEHKRE
jgi:hypothetical protein